MAYVTVDSIYYRRSEAGLCCLIFRKDMKDTQSDRTEQQSTEERERSKVLSGNKKTPPIEVPGYRARQFIGEGAYGEVWVAVDENTGRRVAIKFHSNRGSVNSDLLASEIEKLVFLSADRYVAQLLEVGWDSDPPYFVMEYIENGSLEDHIKRNGAFAVGDAVEICREVSTGLLHAHGRGVLHCDLKPANILLDQDNKPRLADFGQSRLSNEQKPSLGTLFFMAPEQASLKAVPDARWDVYALGALMYTMLTGEAPHRSEEAVSQIDAEPKLESRLARYQEFLRNAAPLTAHRKVKGVDRHLAEIVDRCLMQDPERRYQSVQSVLEAFEARDNIRDRQPLLILGLLGPLLFLLIVAISGWRGYARAVERSEDMLLQRSLRENSFAAEFVAEAVARRIEGYFSAVEDLATDEAFLSNLHGVLSDAEGFLPALSAENVSDAEIEKHRIELLKIPSQVELTKLLQSRLENPNRMEIASWFVTDSKGTQIASVFDAGLTSVTIAKNFAHRTYFTGLNVDLSKTQESLAHVQDTHLSAEFKSQATNRWKVAVSTPIWSGEEFLGIVALTVELGRLGELLGNEEKSLQHQFNVLVDGRNNSGVIFQHPLFELIPDENERLSLLKEFSESPEYYASLANWDGEDGRSTTNYIDPLSKHERGSAFNFRWVAAQRNVYLDREGQGSGDTGLVVIVQENYDAAAEPVRQIARFLKNLGVSVLLLLVGLVLVLWLLVARALRDPNEKIRKQGGSRQPLSSLHSMETVELPKKIMRRAT